AEDGIRDGHVTGVQTCALPISVSLLASSGRSLTQVASELGVQPSLLRGWRGALSGAVKTPAGPGALAATAAPSPEQTEIRRLQRSEERRVGKECRGAGDGWRVW